jgi:hypothetical protein
MASPTPIEQQKIKKKQAGDDHQRRAAAGLGAAPCNP